MRATSAGDAASTGRRSAIATTGVTAKSLTGIQNGSSAPTTRTPAATGSRATSSAASRSAVAGEVRVLGLGLAAGEAHLARVVAAAGRALDEDDAGLAVAIGVEQGQDAGRPPGPVRRRAPWTDAGSVPPTTTGMSASAGAGRGRGRTASRSTTVGEAHDRAGRG